ncbi:hypothetical protein ILUMI_11161 [Ignelater luminosus]|uniref:Uncharacterized protein n=1 Tax=Ignelater luminosus TaxID=2038154 RepID=A0A8K0D0N1_IGNLU|nr:hypothetical protein ILUMI_11161 [Ignelater luminosus]
MEENNRNISRNRAMGIICFFDFQLFFEDSDEEEETDHQNDKVENFAEEVVPRMNNNQFKMHFRLSFTAFEDLLNKLHTCSNERNSSARGYPKMELEKGALIML